MRSVSIKITILLSLLLILAGCQQIKDYRKKPYAKLTALTPTFQLKEKWHYKTGAGSTGDYLKLNPAVGRSDRIFTASHNGIVTAVNRKTGHKIWQIHTKLPYTSGIAISRHYLYVAARNGNLYAYRQNNGRLVWTAKLPGEVIATPTVYRGSLLVKTINGHLLNLKLIDGKQQWAYSEPVPRLILHASSSAKVASGIVVAGFSDGKLVALTFSGGQLLWRHTLAIPQGYSPVERMIDIDVDPVIANGDVYISSYHGKLAAYKLIDGQEIWNRDMSSFSGLYVDRYNVYITDATSHVFAIDRRSGAVNWQQAKLKGRGLTAPAVMGGIVFVADKLGYVHGLSRANGRLIARYYLGKDSVLAAPIVLGNHLFVSTTTGRLFDLQAKRVSMA